MSVPEGFGVVPIPGVGVMLDGLPVPIPGVGVMPVPGIAPVPIPGVGAKPVPPPPVPGVGARPVPCARAALALPAKSTAAKTTANFGCVMIALACVYSFALEGPRPFGVGNAVGSSRKTQQNYLQKCSHSAAGKRAFGAGWRSRFRERKKSPEAVEIGPARSTGRASSFGRPCPPVGVRRGAPHRARRENGLGTQPVLSRCDCW